jgi:hypothetical protein
MGDMHLKVQRYRSREGILHREGTEQLSFLQFKGYLQINGTNKKKGGLGFRAVRIGVESGLGIRIGG